MPSRICMIGVILFIVVLNVESSYYAYTYDNGNGDDEHCCLARLGEKFCLAKPLTSSLIQVNKQCQQLDINEKNKNYLNKIVRRLNIESCHKVGDKVLLQLQNSLDEDILNNDLVCLSANNNNLNLEKCYVELAVVKKKKQKRKAKNETVIEEEKSADDENPNVLVEVLEPVYVRKGHGLSVRQTYELNLTASEELTRKQRDCWSWYRKNTKNILNYPSKSKTNCISLNEKGEECLEQLFQEKFLENQDHSYTTVSVTVGSKLYCDNNNQQTKLLGYHFRSEVCFSTHYQVYVDHKFTDFVSLSDKNNNKGVLKFILNNTKLTNEFESDCNDKITLYDLKKLVEAAIKPNIVVEETSSNTADEEA